MKSNEFSFLGTNAPKSLQEDHDSSQNESDKKDQKYSTDIVQVQSTNGSTAFFLLQFKINYRQ